MPVTIVVGGQYGSEGKGKVASFLAREQGAAAVVRVGGTNSGHTPDNSAFGPLQQLPTAAYDPKTVCVLPPGAYIEPGCLLAEIERTGISADRLLIDQFATVISSDQIAEELTGQLSVQIGSTASGTGAAVWDRVRRAGRTLLAKDAPELAPFVRPTAPYLRQLIDAGQRVLVEGTQGFGLSLLHGGHYPYATSRDTTAAAALAEAGMSPLDVDDVVLVIRAFPIRVAGNSGPLPRETSWTGVTRVGGHDHELLEHTTVTRKIRRVAEFDPEVVIRAIQVNRPSTIVMNHLDYVDHEVCQMHCLTPTAEEFVFEVQNQIGAPIDLVGISKEVFIDRRGSSKRSLRTLVSRAS